MNMDELIKMTEAFVRQNMTGYDSGHDWWHVERVRKLALFINEQEAIADPFTLEIAALLHDSVDSKFAGNDFEQGYVMIMEFLDKIGLTEIKEQVIGIIRNVSFSNKNPSGNLTDPVLLIIQDADRLDAIGAIGIARAFNYGGFRNNIIYNSDLDLSRDALQENHPDRTSSTISHFYEKLLVLKYRMNTLTAKRLAVDRHDFLEVFLKQFYKEWEFGTGVKNS
ncbi:MAG: HD domain-containing protein [Bacteroidia bacterium]|nr:HD domain-containing protein [Bacteroidia bacterium]